MKEINIASGNYLFVEVPDDATDFKYDCDSVILYNSKLIFNEKGCKGGMYDLPKSEIISTTKDISEEQAGLIVEFDEINGEHPDFVNGVAWLNYITNYYEYNIPFIAKDSLQSLIEANGLDITKNYLILKKL